MSGFYNWALKTNSVIESGSLGLAPEPAYAFNICTLANQIEVITKRAAISILLLLLGITCNGQKNIGEGGVWAVGGEEPADPW